MVISQGHIYWANLPDPTGSGPGFRRPVLVVQGDALNRSRVRTVVCIALTSNLRWVEAPGNVLLPTRATGLPKDSVANASQIITLDRELLTEEVGKNASLRFSATEAEPGVRTPTRYTFFGCCASLRETVASNRIASSQIKIFLFIRFSPVFLPTGHCQLLSNYLIRPRRNVRRNRQADLLSGFEIYDEFKLRRLLDG
jgi:mRNA interferase MazF